MKHPEALFHKLGLALRTLAITLIMLSTLILALQTGINASSTTTPSLVSLDTWVIFEAIVLAVTIMGLSSGGSYLMIAILLPLSSLGAIYSLLLSGPGAQPLFLLLGSMIWAVLVLMLGFDFLSVAMCWVEGKPVGWILYTIIGGPVLRLMGWGKEPK